MTERQKVNFTNASTTHKVSRVLRPVALPTERIPYLDYYDNDIELAVETLYNMCNKYQFSKKSRTDSHGNPKRYTCPEFITFDTETTSVPPMTVDNPSDEGFAFVYLAQFYISGKLFLFHDMKTVAQFLETAAAALDSINTQVVIYVHNLNYEFHFMNDWIPFHDGFALNRKGVLKVMAYDSIFEFRCSFKLSGYGLEKFCESYALPQFQKDKEGIDYQIIRLPYEKVSDEMLYYALMDVVCLHNALMRKMMAEGTTVTTIPLTVTGYTRQRFWNKCLFNEYGKGHKAEEYRKKHGITVNLNSKEGKELYEKRKRQILKYRDIFHNCELSLAQYRFLSDVVFRGGNTHASRFHAVKKLHNVGSVDLSSAYPAAIYGSNEFPIGPLFDCTYSMNNLEQRPLCIERYWVAMSLYFPHGAHIRDNHGVPIPYISVSKCPELRRSGNCIADNGRLLETEEPFHMGCLGLELDIILKQYEGDFIVEDAVAAKKGYLPMEIRSEVFHMFKEKTVLKNVKGKEIELQHVKGCFNSTYGMMVERIVRPVVEMDPETRDFTERPATDEEAAEAVHNFFHPSFKSKPKFLPYPWGVTVTAIVRRTLQEAIDVCGNDVVYCDTDSVKMLNPEQHWDDIQKINDRWIAHLDSQNLPHTAYTQDGKKQTIGIWDREADSLTFATLGAKKYATEKLDKKTGKVKFEITIAGVPKAAGAELVKTMDNFIEGGMSEDGLLLMVDESDPLELRQKWKKRLSYNRPSDRIKVIRGQEVEVRGNIYMELTPYRLSITPKYRAVLDEYLQSYQKDSH